MNHIETIIENETKLRTAKQSLETAMKEALGYTVLITSHEAAYSLTGTVYFSIWKKDTDHQTMSVRYITCVNGDYWDDHTPDKFSREDLNIMEEVLNGTV